MNTTAVKTSNPTMYKVSVSVNFISEGQIAQPPAVIDDQVVIEGNTSLMFSDELVTIIMLFIVEEREVRYS
jgi:hypothetical protein